MKKQSVVSQQNQFQIYFNYLSPIERVEALDFISYLLSRRNEKELERKKREPLAKKMVEIMKKTQELASSKTISEKEIAAEIEAYHNESRR